MATPDYAATDSTCLFCDEVVEESQRGSHAKTRAHKRNRSCVLEWWKQCSTEGWKLACEQIQITYPSFHCGICNESGEWYTCFEHCDRKSHKAHRVDYEAAAIKAAFTEQLEAHKMSCQAVSTAQVESLKSSCPTVTSSQHTPGRRLEIGGDVVFLGEVKGLSALTVVSKKGLSGANDMKSNLMTDFETHFPSDDPMGVEYVRHISEFPDGSLLCFPFFFLPSYGPNQFQCSLTKDSLVMDKRNDQITTLSKLCNEIYHKVTTVFGYKLFPAKGTVQLPPSAH